MGGVPPHIAASVSRTIKTVIVAEDDPFFRETIQLQLESHAVSVRTTRNGEEAIQAIDSAVPDLLLLDLLMPKKDGFAVLAHIREKKIELPVVILSNLLDEIDNEKCFAMGAKAYFVKNEMDEDELWPKISQYL